LAINFLNPKIKIKDLTITTNGNTLIFSYNLPEKQEKELNLAAGKIHRQTVKQQWNVEGTKITLTIPKEEIKNVAFGEIKDLFEQMVN
jgi:hypothetical protein